MYACRKVEITIGGVGLRGVGEGRDRNSGGMRGNSVITEREREGSESSSGSGELGRSDRVRVFERGGTSHDSKRRRRRKQSHV